MPTPAFPLEDLAQQITQHETQLTTLRREYEVRQTLLAELARRKDELQGQLRQLDAEIKAVSRGSVVQKPARQPEPAATPPAAPTAQVATLADLLVQLVRDAGGQPVTVKTLADEVSRRRFPTRSRNIPGLVQTKVNDMARKGIFARLAGRPGVVLGKSEKAKAASTRRLAATGKGNGRPGTAKQKPAKGKPGRVKGQPPLREVLTDILKKRRQPLGSGQLARQILATGFKTNSKDFATVVSVALNKLPNLERVPGQGFRFKKGKG
jgi:hypothetical protein